MADVAAVIVNEPKGACARCGRTDAIERHHWAPVHLFPDAWDWPMSPLCPDCHRLWHTVTRTGASSTDRARGFDSYTAPEADLWDTDLKDGFGGAF